MPLKSNQEWAELYQTAIEALVTDNVASYSIAGRSFTRQSLETLERLYRYYAGRAAADKHGRVTYSDMSRESFERE